MSNKAKTLFIVEGAKSEKNFFQQLNLTHFTNIDLFIYGTNIYDLYRRIKEFDFNANLLDLLKDLPDDPQYPNDKSILEHNFAYTYLVFDFDVHHRDYYQATTPLQTLVDDNIEKLVEMSNHFVDETDPTVGKLYINYPMMESYKDCDVFFDPNYKDNYVNLSDIKKYKSIVGEKNLSRIRLDSYTKENIDNLVKMNIFKLSELMDNNWGVIDYETYLRYCNSSDILSKQKDLVIKKHKISVLNTSLFFLTDYFGNQNGYYDSLINT